MFENTKAILHSFVEGKPPRKGAKTNAMVDNALFEIFTANKKLQTAGAEIEALKKELAETKERVAQDAINSLHGNIGGEYNATR